MLRICSMMIVALTWPALAGGGWTLTGGFWPVTVDATDRFFSDGFES